MRNKLHNISCKIACLLLITASPLSAQARKLNVDYPSLGLDIEFAKLARGDEALLPLYLRYIFSAIIILFGLIIFFSFIWGGITIMTSAGNPYALKDGRRRIIDSLIGLALAAGSGLLIGLVRPDLVDMSEVSPDKEPNRVSAEILISDGEKKQPISTGTINLKDTGLERIEYVNIFNATGIVDEEEKWIEVEDVINLAVILHDQENGAGRCIIRDSQPIFDKGYRLIDFKIETLSFNPKSITVIRQDLIFNPKSPNYSKWNDFIEKWPLIKQKARKRASFSWGKENSYLWSNIDYEGDRSTLKEKEIFDFPFRYQSLSFNLIPNKLKENVWSAKPSANTIVLLTEGGGPIHERCSLISEDMRDLNGFSMNRCNPTQIKDTLYWEYNSCATHYHLFPVYTPTAVD